VYPTIKFVTLLRTNKIGISFFPRVNPTNFVIFFEGEMVIKKNLFHEKKPLRFKTLPTCLKKRKKKT
jgi:hypothetical protein